MTSWPFSSYTAALAFADSVLERPPAYPYLRRVEGVGQRIVRFALPLELCPSTNVTLEAIRLRRKDGSARWIKPTEAKRKQDLGSLMKIQEHLQGWHPEQGPLPGRPQVLCVRFSPQQCDPYSDWAKSAVDKLTPRGGLNLIVDDRLSKADVWSWWEPSQSRKGCVLVEVWARAELPHLPPQKGDQH